MWFEDQQGRMVNSDKILVLDINSYGVQWAVRADPFPFNGDKDALILYQGDKEKCRVWLKKLVTTINQFKQGIM